MREARKRSPGERSAFLDGACAGDDALRKRLEATLARPNPCEPIIPEDAEVTQAATLTVDFADTAAEVPGQMFGRYQILQKSGTSAEAAKP